MKKVLFGFLLMFFGSCSKKHLENTNHSKIIKEIEIIEISSQFAYSQFVFNDSTYIVKSVEIDNLSYFDLKIGQKITKEIFYDCSNNNCVFDNINLEDYTKIKKWIIVITIIFVIILFIQ